MADDIKIVGLSTKKNNKPNWKIISAIIGIIVLSIGVIAGIFLVRQQQDIREKAAGNCDNPQSIVQCPRSDGALVSCNPPDGNNNAQISTCNVAGRVEMCGLDSNVKQYCCPSAGGAWTLDMTACTCTIQSPTGMTVDQISSTTAILKWTSGTGSSFSKIWVSTNADPTGCDVAGTGACIIRNQQLPSTTTQYELTNLTPNTKYYWQMMAWNREGCDSGTAVLNFTTTAVGATATATSTATATATATSTSSSNNNSSRTTTPTATSTSRASATATSRGTSTARATSTSKSTAFPVPETGTDLPTMLGVGFGVVMLLISLALAL